MVALIDSDIALVALCTIALMMPHRYRRIVRPTLIIGDRRHRAIQPSSDFQLRSATLRYEYDHRPLAASLIRQARAVFRFIFVNRRNAPLSRYHPFAFV